MGVVRLGALGTVASVTLFVMASPASATPCGFPDECPAGFCVDGVCCDVACTGLCEGCSAAAKGGGVDGTCGPVPAGTVCEPSHCDGPVVSFYADAVCDAMGACLGPPPVSCILEEPCTFDLCDHEVGCDQAKMLDGTPCGEDLVCTRGACGPSMSASSTGTGGEAGGAGGDAASGGAGGAPLGDLSDRYPPADDGCGCRAAEGAAGGLASSVMTTLAMLLAARRRRRRT